MNTQAIQDRIEKAEAELAEARKLLEQQAAQPKPGLWKPGLGGKYYVLSMYGEPIIFCWKDDGYDHRTQDFGNTFPDEDTARKAAKLMARSNKIIRAALQVDPDAGEWGVGRTWAVIEDNSLKKWVPYAHTAYCAAYVHTKEQAQQMADILNATNP